MDTLADIIAAPWNPREIEPEAIAGLKVSLHEFGDLSGIVVTVDGTLIAGHQRVRAIREEHGDLPITDGAIQCPDGERFPVRVVEGWTAAKIRAANIAANSQAISGHFTPAVGPMLEELKVELPELHGALRLGEIEVPAELPTEDPEDAEPQIDKAAELQEQWQVERGDVWLCPSRDGKRTHRVMCGDYRDAGDAAALCVSVVNGVCTSPPYAEQRKQQYGGIPADDYVEWWESVQANVRTHLAADGSFFVNIKPHCENGERVLYVMELVLAMQRQWGWRYIDEFCWTHPGSPGRVTEHFKNQFEPIYQFAKGKIKVRPEAVAHASDRVPQGGGPCISRLQGAGNALARVASAAGQAYPGNHLEVGRNDQALGHSAAFPIGLPTFFAKAFTDPGDILLDPFLGSGTTLIAAENLGRVCYGMEIEPKYVAVALQRYKDAFDITPVREEA